MIWFLKDCLLFWTCHKSGELIRGTWRLLSEYGIASVCANHDLLFSRRLFFILNMLQVRTSSEEECVGCSLHLGERRCVQNMTFLFLKDYLLFWTCYTSGRVQTRNVLVAVCLWHTVGVKKYDLLVSKRFSFISNMLHVRTSSDEECVLL